ncbi:MAG: BamA/TamA family outer membrane protein [Pseudomonadota bacterium]
MAMCLALLLSGAAWGDVRIEADGIPDDLREALEAARPDDPAPETRFEARRQARRAATRLTDFLNSEAFFDARVTPYVEPGPPIVPTVRVETGPQFKVSGQEITYVGRAPDEAAQAAAKAALTLNTGDVPFPDLVLIAEQQALAALKDAGYGTVEVRPRDVVGDRAAGTVEIIYSIAAGPKIELGDVIYEDPIRIRPKYRERIVPFDLGEVYSPDKLATLDERLAASRLYSIFGVRLAEAGAPSETGETETRNVIVSATERPRNTITAGASFSTAEGPGATLEWTRRNLTRRGDELRLRTVLADLERSLGADWLLPHAFGYGRALTANVFGGREDTDAFDRTTALLGLGLDIDRGGDLRLLFGSAVEYTNETDVSGERDLFIYSVSSEALIDKANSLLDPTNGWRARARIEPGLIAGDTNDNFTSVIAEASVYEGFGGRDRYVLAGRVRAGSVFGAASLDLPTSRRFFAGGGGSARGFGFQDIGPRDEDNVPIGGRGLLELAGEARWRFRKNIGLAAFVDGASVTSDAAPSFNDFRVGAGVGVRYYTAIGPIRFDIATPLNPQEGDDPVQVYISIGQAF